MSSFLLLKCIVGIFIVWLWAGDVSAVQIIPRRVKCRSISHRECFATWYTCPARCPTTCLMNCVICRPVCSCDIPGAICEDPRFVGGDGITFYFHGEKDQNFCLVSDSNLHINGHFIGKRNPKLTRDFTWVQSIGLIVNNHRILFSAKKTSSWDDFIDRLDISIDDSPISIPTVEGATWHSQLSPTITIARISTTNKAVLEVEGSMRMTATVVPITVQESRVHGYNIGHDNCFAHLELGFKFYNLSKNVDGVLGQTYRSDYVSRAKINVPMPVMGGVEKYKSSEIFATDCRVSQYGSKNVVKSDGLGLEHSSMKCKSGSNGMGIMCKR